MDRRRLIAAIAGKAPEKNPLFETDTTWLVSTASRVDISPNHRTLTVLSTLNTGTDSGGMITQRFLGQRN